MKFALIFVVICLSYGRTKLAFLAQVWDMVYRRAAAQDSV